MKTINNKPFWYDPKSSQSFQAKPKEINSLEYWDSLLEFKVYERLLTNVPASSIKRQEPIIIFEKSALFPKWNWLIDFQIIGITSQPIFIEAKGKWLPGHSEAKHFWKTLKMIQVFKPEVFSRLLIVGEGTPWLIPRTKIQVHDYKSIHNLIREITNEQYTPRVKNSQA